MFRVPFTRAAAVLFSALVILAMSGVPTMAQQIPPPPDPVPVTLDPATTALFIMDLTESTCGGQPNCREMVPRVAALLQRARAAGVFVAYTAGTGGGTVGGEVPVFLPEVAPTEHDPIVTAGQNKFLGTPLDDYLRVRGIKTIILAGWRANGSVLFTSHGATYLRYTVVVAQDGTSAANPHDVAIGMYMVLNLLNGNPTNEPLRQGAVTLSRTDLISFE